MELQEIVHKMDELQKEKKLYEFYLKNIQKEEEKLELEMQNILHKVEAETMEYGVYTFGWKETTRKAFNQKAFGEAHPELLEKFKLESVSRKFEFKINK
jgi:predicted phage-related endonuclease